ncbi:MAG: PorP/SprF family type IX secretion system membrane protein [Flavobacteriales bacterium]|nr:PorP/SprF family type IX secretion system membrane protein [Flavobacteriales bacterium]
MSRILFLAGLLSIGMMARTQMVSMDVLGNYLSATWNPALTGSEHRLAIHAWHRQRWNIKGGPAYSGLFAEKKINDRFGTGIQVNTASWGVTDAVEGMLSANTGFVVNKARIRMGLAVGMRQLNAHLTQVGLADNLDPEFASDIIGQTEWNVGYGFGYTDEKYEFGYAVPRLLQYNYYFVNGELKRGMNGGFMYREMNLHAMRTFNFTDQMSGRVQVVMSGIPVNGMLWRINAVTEWNNTIIGGATGATNGSVGLIVGATWKGQWRICYAGELMQGKTGAGNLSHAIALSFLLSNGNTVVPVTEQQP